MNMIHGALVNITDNSNINLGTVNPFRYRSYYYDEETSLYYLNSRYYNPEIGRFINADLVITGQEINSTNIFMYCGNNPVDREDLSGEWYLPGKSKKYKKVKGYSLLQILKEVIFNKKKKEDLHAGTQNCYAYATDLSDDTLNPGDISKYTSKSVGKVDYTDIDSIKNAVIADLEVDDRRAREVYGPDSYLYPDEYMIAIRCNEIPLFFGKDYHFMVRDDDGVWSEKKGLDSSRIVNGTPESFGVWSPRMNSKTVYLAISKG